MYRLPLRRHASGSGLGLGPRGRGPPDIAAALGASDLKPDAMVLGDAGSHFTFDGLNAAFRLLMAGCPLIAMARNRYFKESDDLTLDLGAFVAALGYGAGVTAEIVGKPAAPSPSALAELGVAPGEAVLIGDDLRDDIGGAHAGEIPDVLVRTGKFRAGDEADRAVQPALVVNDFSATVAIMVRGG